MHELSIAEGIAEAVEKTAAAEGASRVLSVRVAIGELATVEIPALLFAWRSLRDHDPLREAELTIERVPGQAWCFNCQETVALPAHGRPCPRCGGYRLTPTQGHELRVLDIEIGDPAPGAGPAN